MSKENGTVAENNVLPPVTADVPMPPVRAAKPEVRWIRDEQVITGPGGRPCTDEEKKALAGATLHITLDGLSDKDGDRIADAFPGLHYVGGGSFESAINAVTPEEQHDFMMAAAAEVQVFIRDRGILAEPSVYDSVKEQLTKHAVFHELEAWLITGEDAAEWGSYTCIKIKIFAKALRRPGISSVYKDHLQRNFPEAVIQGQWVYIPITEHTPYNGDMRTIANTISLILGGSGSEVPGVQPDEPWPRDEGAMQDAPVNPNFLTRRFPGFVPPRPGSEELSRQSIILSTVKKREATDVDQAIQLLNAHVEQLNPTATEAEKDPAIAALGALRRVKQEARKKKFHSRLKWFFALLLLVGIGVAFYFYGSLLYTRGHYTTVATCKVPFGDSEITGSRYSTFTTKSLLGYRVGPAIPEVESTEIKLPGENLTVLGFDSGTSKFWRVNYGKGESNTPKLRVTDMYWFLGDKDKTALVKYEDFCR